MSRPQGDAGSRRRAAAALILTAAWGLGSIPPVKAMAQTRDPDLKSALAAVLQASASAWSRGDLGGFMGCYEDAPATAYVNGQGLVQGYDTIRRMYATRFKGEPGAMGRLSTELIEVRRLGPDYAVAYGRFALQRPAGEAHGVFSLVFHRSAAGWKIVSDHTS